MDGILVCMCNQPSSFLFHRTFQTRYQYLHNAQRNILDGTLLYQYLSLTAKEKFDFSKQIGTTVAQVKNTVFIFNDSLLSNCSFCHLLHHCFFMLDNGGLERNRQSDVSLLISPAKRTVNFFLFSFSTHSLFLLFNFIIRVHQNLKINVHANL